MYIYLNPYILHVCVYKYITVTTSTHASVLRRRGVRIAKSLNSHFMMPLGGAPRERVLEAVAAWPQLFGSVHCNMCMVGSGLLWKLFKLRTNTC